MTVQAGEIPAAATDVTWPGQLIEAELAAMLGRRLAELDFLGADIAAFDDVLGGLIRGPGKRLRPAFVYWGYRARRRAWRTRRRRRPPGGLRGRVPARLRADLR